MLPYVIKTISINDCLPLRRDVLWPSLQLKECLIKGDEEAIHYGYIINHDVISCFSLFSKSPTHYQLRKFATKATFQRQGIGSILLKTVVQILRNQQIKTISLNARLSAMEFYKKFNFTVCGDEFTQNDVTFVPMQGSVK